MKSAARTYASPLRKQQAAATRERILQALASLVTEDGLDEVSFKAVAEAAGLTEITIYRHFRNRVELRRALWSWLDVRLGGRGMPRAGSDLADDARVVLAGFDDHAPLIRAALLSKEGRAMRMAVQPERRAGFEAALAAPTAGLGAAERTRAMAIIQLLYSAHAWMSMRDQWGLTGQQAGEASAWAIGVLLENLRHQQRGRRRRAAHQSPGPRAKRSAATTRRPSR